MNIREFSIEFQQKFDFGGKPYRFNKYDFSLGDIIDTTSDFYIAYKDLSASEKGNIMLVLSDDLFELGLSSEVCKLSSGSVVYLSTLLNFISNGQRFEFGSVCQVTPKFNESPNTLRVMSLPLAGTIYIFDFNPIYSK